MTDKSKKNHQDLISTVAGWQPGALWVWCTPAALALSGDTFPSAYYQRAGI